MQKELEEKELSEPGSFEEIFKKSVIINDSAPLNFPAAPNPQKNV